MTWLHSRIDSANDDSYLPPELSDATFTQWALRITIKLRNLPPRASDYATRRVLVSEGVPSPAWVQAYTFMIGLRLDKRGAA